MDRGTTSQVTGLREAEAAVTPRRYKPYPAYKDSGVEWLGEIPAHWEVKRLKYLFTIVNGSTPKTSESQYWDGVIPWVTPDDLGDLNGVELKATARSITELGYQSCGTTLVSVGSLVLSTRAPIGHLAIAAVPLCTNQGCRALVFRRPQHGRFFYYQVFAAHAELESLGQGSTFTELATDKLASVWLGVPPDPEQEAIAAFLDRETAKVDALVAKKERLIELLQEKRTAIISQAVTKGLNPAAPMKPSSVEWLGDIPAHWEVCRVRDVAASLQTGPFGSQLHSEEYVVGGTPVINPANLRGDRIEADWGCTVDETTRDRLAKHSLSDGDIVFARRGEMGRCGLVTQGEAGWLCGTGSLRVRLKEKVVNSRYVSLVLASSGTREWLQLESVGATMENLNTHIIGRIPMVVPPLPEQGEIGVLVERRVAGIDSLTSKVQEHIEKLKEYRAALISAAVTGKIDVREEAA